MTRAPEAHKPAVDPVFLTGSGLELLSEAARVSGLTGVGVLRQIVAELLVHKGVDWTVPILAEYLGLFDSSRATFVVAWDRLSRRFISHGAMFQSSRSPSVGLVAHIRTDERFKGLGLGTQVTRRVVEAGLANGAKVIALATDDKLVRLKAGERAATGLYSRLGFAVLALKTLADTVDWLMIVDREAFAAASQHGGPATKPAEGLAPIQERMVSGTHAAFSRRPSDPQIQPVTSGDLAALFLLFNLCPPVDFRLKLSPWNIQLGPELEREFVVGVRPALEDQDRLEEASHILRNEDGLILAVCAATQERPFTRKTYRLDFYCVPDFLRDNRDLVRDLCKQTIARLTTHDRFVGPALLAFWGVDQEKIALFRELGFNPTSNTSRFHTPDTGSSFEAGEFVRDVQAS